jgi:hypothetical protein
MLVVLKREMRKEYKLLHLNEKKNFFILMGLFYGPRNEQNFAD